MPSRTPTAVATIASVSPVAAGSAIDRVVLAASAATPLFASRAQQSGVARVSGSPQSSRAAHLPTASAATVATVIADQLAVLDDQCRVPEVNSDGSST